MVSKDGSDIVYGVEYIVARDVQDSNYGGEYYYEDYIMEKMKEHIVLAQSGEMGNLKFHHYSLLIQVIHICLGFHHSLINLFFSD